MNLPLPFRFRRTVAVFAFGVSMLAGGSIGQQVSPQTAPAGSAPPVQTPVPAQSGQPGTITPAPAAATAPFVAATPEGDMFGDWANLNRFRKENMALPEPGPGDQRVVFLGDSIIQNWLEHDVEGYPPGPVFFPGKTYINRGISGQTTPQILLRVRQDVIKLKPTVVVVLAGTNDIAANTGQMSAEDTESNLASMADLAREHGIRVVLCSILPVSDYPWSPGRNPAQKVAALNLWIRNYAASQGFIYVDFYSAMADEHGGLPASLSHDGVHPNQAGYDIMNPLVEAGIAHALRAK